jgi:hypothetical protein
MCLRRFDEDEIGGFGGGGGDRVNMKVMFD